MIVRGEAVIAVEGEVRTIGRMAVDMLEVACRIHTDFMMTRYLMANAHGRWDGAEKAQRHQELCSFYVAIFHGYESTERAAREQRASYVAVHAATQRLTDNLDEEIGFPLDRQPDYDALVPAFFKRFHALALTALQSDASANSGGG